MKHIKLFEQFINEGYSYNSVKNDVMKLFISAGFSAPEVSYNSIFVKLPDGINKAPTEIIKLDNEIKKYAKSNDGILISKIAVGYSLGNSYSVMLAPNESVRVNKVYHKTSRKNAEDILKNGMIAKEAHEHSDTFGSGASGGASTVQLYKAIFAVSSIASARKLDQYFNFDKDAVILEIDGKGYSWMPDPLMPPDMKSIFTYDNIKAQDISIKE